MGEIGFELVSMLFAIGDVVVHGDVTVGGADEDVWLEHFCVVESYE